MRGKPGHLLTKRAATQVGSIANAVVAKDGPLYFLTDPAARIPLRVAHGFGLYCHDCRFLDGYDIRLGRAHPDVLAASAARGFAADFRLTNGEIDLSDGTRVPKERVGIAWTRLVDGHALALCETLALANHGVDLLDLPLSLAFSAGFQDLFVVRGLQPEHTGRVTETRWLRRDLLLFLYHGGDDLWRSLAIRFDPPPTRRRSTTASWRLRLEPQREVRLHITLQLAEERDKDRVLPAEDHGGTGRPHERMNRLSRSLQAQAADWLEGATAVTTDNPRINAAVQRAIVDLGMLRTGLHGLAFFAAGVPWYVTLFGRDSLISALQALAFDPAIAADTLRLLARFQGRRENAWRCEEPGKIPHELRVGELANMGAIPYTPYYGTIDATPLWLILLGRHAAWSGSLELFRELRGSADAALAWMEKYGDLNGDGFLEYDVGPAPDGIVNQGWKDSGDAIVNADGSIATPPIALVEVQGYAWLARLELARLLEQDGDAVRAAELRGAAHALRDRFQREFWLPDPGTYALALQKDHRPCAVVSSNPGQALWTGIVEPAHARALRDSLLSQDMFSGWGIRTLSAREKRYNPVGYHLGTVWPHDNAFAAAGLHRHGFHDDALRILDALLAASDGFPHHRLPEVFAGFPPAGFARPVHYPVACHPQAWAAGAIPFLLTELLGLQPDALHQRLRIVDPVLPSGVSRLELRGLRIGPARLSLRFNSSRQGVRVRVTDQDGQLDVLAE